MSKIDAALYERLRSVIEDQKFIQHLGAEVEALQSGHCEISLLYDERWSQQDGCFHRGVVGALADNAAGLAGATTMVDGANCLTVEYKLNLLAPAKGKRLLAKAKVIKAGRTLVIAETNIYCVNGSEERHVAMALVTLIAV